MEKANFGDFCAKLADDLPEYESTVDADDEIEQGTDIRFLVESTLNSKLNSSRFLWTWEIV